jgi:hypothetical protein
MIVRDSRRLSFAEFGRSAALRNRRGAVSRTVI